MQTSGEGWRTVSNDAVQVDGITYIGYTRPGHGNDMHIMVGSKELCFHNQTKWDIVVTHIRNARTEQAKVIYIARENSDLTEGRGPMRTLGYYTEPEPAIARVQGRGVMGVGHGEVSTVKLDIGRVEERLFWGNHANPAGKWVYGYADNRDDPILSDPEYPEYVRLRKKFE